VTSSIKDQLHTLVEEEEEEEESVASPPSALSNELPAVIGSPSPARHRPAGLHLRPLSLSPDRLMSAAAGELPTPESAATPTKPAGLKSLTLATSPSVISTCPASDGILSKATALHRRSVVPPHASASAPFFRRASLTESTSSTSSDPFEVPRKRSSISYKSSFHGLPTPELTPTTEGRPPIGSEIDWARHASLTNEQHFLYQSQAALVARISELERTLSSRSQTRPISFAASDSSLSDAEPSDEMLRLIADLKAELDELKRDIDGWRACVADLEEKSGAVALRVDTERREDAERSKEIADELERVGSELEEERRLCEVLEKSLEKLSVLETPTTAGSVHRVVSSSIAILRLALPSRASSASVQAPFTRLQTLWTA
jgi:hypothetical protein